jgi:hypothetical protein
VSHEQGKNLKRRSRRIVYNLPDMQKKAPFSIRLVLCAAIGLVSAAAQNEDVPPDQPFQAVHLINLTSAGEERALLAAFADINAAIAKAGCPQCAYHLWKVYGTQAGGYNYLWSSSWPGRAVYLKVHMSAEYQAAIKKHQDMEKTMASQTYNRYVEVTPGK